MSRDPVAVRTITPERYPVVFAELVARSLEYEGLVAALQRWTRDRFEDGFSLIDVGAGTGAVWSAWFAEDVPRPGSIIAWEPTPVHAEALRLAGRDLGVDRIEVRSEPFTLEIAETLPGFDAAVFSHSLYWIPRPAETLLATRRRARTGGAVAAVVQAPFAVHQLATLFEPRMVRDRPAGPDHRFSSDELMNALASFGETDLAVRYLPGGFDLSDLDDPAAASRIDELLSFALQVEFAACPDAFRDEVRRLLDAACVRREDGIRFWNEPGAFIELRA